MDFIIFIGAMTALIYGADFIIERSEAIASRYNISPFVIGATLIALGTSLPEMAVSAAASLKGNADIAVANVIGSTIFNIALVLGTVFLIARSIKPKRDIFTQDSVWALLPILIFILMAFDGKLNQLDGLLFIILMVGYILFLFRSNQMEEDQPQQDNNFSWPLTLLFLFLGFILTIGGAHFTVSSATAIASYLGVSDWIIALFLIALGTSLPELMISIKAALKNNADLAIGNIIGSNVANFTMVLGLSALIHPLNVDLKGYSFDIMAALFLSVILVLLTANRLYNKSAGIILFIILALVIQNSLIHS